MEIYYDPSRDGREAVIPLGACIFCGSSRGRDMAEAVNGEPEAVGGGVASTGRVRQRREENQKYSRRSKDGKNNGGV